MAANFVDVSKQTDPTQHDFVNLDLAPAIVFTPEIVVPEPGSGAPAHLLIYTSVRNFEVTGEDAEKLYKDIQDALGIKEPKAPKKPPKEHAEHKDHKEHAAGHGK